MPKSDRAERSFRFHYSTSVSMDHARSAPVDVWIPLPHDTEEQVIGPVEIASPVAWTDNIEPRSGNRMLHAQIAQGSEKTAIVVRYDVKRKRMRADKPSETADYGPDFDPKKYGAYLSPNANVPITGFIAQQAKAVTHRRDPPVVRARKLFEYLMNTLEYDWAGCTPDRIDELGNLAQACDLRKGTCTEFHGLYVGYARSMGIPAKFNFGFNVPEDKEEGIVGGYHCWAEILLPDVGWFPIDVTEAVKARSKNQGAEAVDFYFGGVDCHRVHISSGRDLSLEPRQRGGLVDKLIFSHAVCDGRKVEPDLSFAVSPAKEL